MSSHHTRRSRSMLIFEDILNDSGSGAVTWIWKSTSPFGTWTSKVLRKSTFLIVISLTRPDLTCHHHRTQRRRSSPNWRLHAKSGLPCADVARRLALPLLHMGLPTRSDPRDRTHQLQQQRWLSFHISRQQQMAAVLPKSLTDSPNALMARHRQLHLVEVVAQMGVESQS